MKTFEIKIFIKTVIIGILGVIVFKLIHAPVPYLLGPMFAILVANRIWHTPMNMPKQLQLGAQIVIGYSLGISFNKSILGTMLTDIPLMLIITTILFIFSCIFAFFISKNSDIDFPTALTSSVPGGLTQIVIFAQEMKGIELSTVTFFHAIRVIMVVFLVPFVVHMPFLQSGNLHISTDITTLVNTFNGFHFIIYIVLCTIASLLAKKIKVPAPYLLGPIIMTILINLTSFYASALPHGLLNICQMVVGIHIGLLLHPESLKDKKKIFLFAITSSVFLVLITFIMSIIIMKDFQHTSIITGFLSLAPGGMDQMGIIAHEVHADVATVTIYQLFRILYIYIIIPPVLTLVLHKFQKKE
ncbi:AbrB family transcriptional regulator [Rummeliibacillus sp. JY-2-4R]